MVPRLGPGIGKEQEQAIEAGRRQARHEVARVAGVEAHVGQVKRIDVAKRAGHPVHERLGAEEEHVGPPRRLGRQVLAAAKADLQPDLPGAGRQRQGIERRLGRGDLRQQGLQQSGLARLYRPRPDPAEGADGAARGDAAQPSRPWTRIGRSAVGHLGPR